jgi:hypothetical protein
MSSILIIQKQTTGYFKTAFIKLNLEDGKLKNVLSDIPGEEVEY